MEITMYNFGYGPPPPYGFPYIQPEHPTRNVFEEIDNWITGLKKLKREMKDEDKHDHDKKHRKHAFTFTETVGLLVLTSIPVGILQLLLLSHFKDMLHNIAN
jgi:hypothetical protein